jgi:hypothetical protein
LIKHNGITVVILKSNIKQRQINFAGNERLKIYGTLSCKSGKRMNIKNFLNQKMKPLKMVTALVDIA